LTLNGRAQLVVQHASAYQELLEQLRRNEAKLPMDSGAKRVRSRQSTQGETHLDKLNKKLPPSRRVLLLILATGFAGSFAMGQAPAAKTSQPDRTVLPLAAPPFTGVIGKTYKESKEAWPPLPTAPAGAPNIVVILLDDVGFGQTGTFGGPVPTPELDKLAAQGLSTPAFMTPASAAPHAPRS
jgi:hypothetical protein